ncbi:hypothetical protein GCM10028807_44780 [Spirosoma daeguense]
MIQSMYTSIPDTSDAAYWIIKPNGLDRSITFVPRDKELHKELKQKARKLSQANSSYKNRNKKE